jgi:DNA polymerase
MTGVLVIDYESFSPVILTDTNTDIYTSHPATGVWCAALALDNHPVRIWKPGDPPPEEIFIADKFVAHYVRFEQSLWRHKLTPLYGWSDVPAFERWECTMAACQRRSLPASLAAISEVLRLKHRKADSQIMKQMARPRSPRVGEDPAVLHWDDDPDRFRQLCEYCKRDAEAERELYLWLLRSSETENTLSGNKPSVSIPMALASTAR